MSTRLPDYDPSSVVKRRDLDGLEEAVSKLGESGQHKVVSRWGSLSERTAVLITLVVVVLGFVSQFLWIKHQTETLMESNRAILADIVILREQQARFDEWRKSQGAVPSAREYEILSREVDKLRETVSELEKSHSDTDSKVESSHNRLDNVERSLTLTDNSVKNIAHYTHRHDDHGERQTVVIKTKGGDN